MPSVFKASITNLMIFLCKGMLSRNIKAINATLLKSNYLIRINYANTIEFRVFSDFLNLNLVVYIIHTFVVYENIYPVELHIFFL